MIVHRTKKLLVMSTSVGSYLIIFLSQTELTLIRQLFQELSDLGLLCFQSVKRRLCEVND